MKGLFASLAMLCALCVALPAAQAKPLPGAKYTYTLKSVMPVAGRQGVACDGKFIYVSCSKALYKYDMNGKLVAENKNPFEGYSIPSNHIGDIDVYNGEIYVGAENFMDGVGKDIQIAIHDANTLKFKRTFKFEPKSGQEEVSGITVDPVKKTVWMCSWVGEESGRHLYEYDLRACLETSAFIVTRRHVDKKRLCAAAKTREDCQTVPQRSDGQRMGACTSSPAPCFWRRSEAQNRPA